MVRRRREIPALVAALVAVAIGVTMAGAAAQTGRPVRLDYDAPAGCPDEAAFAAQLRARSTKITVSPDGATVVRVRMSGSRGAGGRFDGEVAIVEGRGREARRHVEGKCADVAAALALITALALDPAASTAADPSAAPFPAVPAASATGAGAPSAAAPAASASTAPPSVPPPAEAKTAAEAKPPPASKAPERAPAPAENESTRSHEGESSAHSWAWAVGVEGGLTSGVAPQALLTVPAFLDVSRRGPDLFAPALRLRFERADSGAVAVAGGGADFTWTAGSADLCPIAWAPWRLRFWPCARVEGGVLQAAGTAVTPSRSDTRPWLTAGAALRGRLTIYGPFFGEIEGTAFAPIVRDRFFIEPSTTIQRAPAVAAGGAAGLGVAFW